MEIDEKLSSLSLQKAAQMWCFDSTKDKFVDIPLTLAVATLIEEIWNQSWLGNATTEELLEELLCRAGVGGYADYKTTEE
jgi:hypothetical protein